VATLTYAYADSTAVVGPLASYAEPHSYDLCEPHALRLTAPRGWEIVRHEGDFPEAEPITDDLTALVEAVREAGRADRADRADHPVVQPPVGAATVVRRSHLRVLPDPTE
jgi:Protein of unknown function (DUF3499)